MVRLIENTVKGLIQLPSQTEGTLSADLLRRVLIPNPKNRYKMKDVVQHPWFQVGSSCSAGRAGIHCRNAAGSCIFCWELQFQTCSGCAGNCDA